MTTPHKPAVSVVIPTWNRVHLVRRAIDSVLEQSFSDFEVMVVDDGSTDGTDQLVTSFADRRVRYIHQTNQGESAARNTGIREAQGRVVTFLDSDDEAKPQWLELLTADVLAGRTELALGGIENVSEGRSSEWIPSPSGPELDEIVNHFEAGQVAFDRQVLDRLGGFSTAIRYGQHTELAIRLLCRTDPPRLSFVPRALVVVHRRSGDRGYGTAQAESAAFVLDHHGDCQRRLPHLWASYNAIVGVDQARSGCLREARAHFIAAARTEPREWQHWGRLFVSTSRVLAGRVWGRSDCEPVVLFVAAAQGVGGSIRSLASVLEYLQGAQRAVACAPGTTFTELLGHRRLADELVELPLQYSARMLARLGGLVKITWWAWRHRRALMAIHANGLAERNLVCLAAALTRTPVIVWMHEWSVSPWTRRLDPLLSRIAPRTRFAAVSEHAAVVLEDAGLATRADIEVVPNPIDPADVVGSDRSVHSKTVIGYLGHPARYKGFHLLPAIIRGVNGNDVEWAVFAGPRSQLPDVWKELDSIGQPDVRIPGKLLDVRAAYAQCDIVLCPSLEESFGRVVAEAMCNGVPVVASDIPALRDLVGDDEAGLLVPPDEPSLAASAVRRLVDDKDLQEQLGAVGRRRAATFAPTPIVDQLCALYGIAARQVPHSEIKDPMADTPSDVAQAQSEKAGPPA